MIARYHHVAPAGTSDEGLPVGVQIVPRHWREDVALAVARRIESALGGWKPPLAFEGRTDRGQNGEHIEEGEVSLA